MTDEKFDIYAQEDFMVSPCKINTMKPAISFCQSNAGRGHTLCTGIEESLNLMNRF